MEFLTGYRAELLELVSLVLGWRRGGRGGPPEAGVLRRLPPEPGPWVLHALPNTRLGVALPAGGARRRVLVVTRVLLLTDARGVPLGFDFELGSPRAPPAPPPARRALALLCRAMGCPMAGGPPRRPRQLTVGDAGLHAPQCRAVLYCSEGCRAAEALGVHRGWCRQLGGFMGRAAALAQLPFTFTAEVTSETFDKEGFLRARGLTRGGWAHLSMLVRAPDYGVGLGGGQPPPRTPHGSWQQYYAWRGLPLSSPLAALLSYPLSLYYVVTSLAPQHFPELNILRKRSLRVQVEESGRELQLVGLFWELSVLLPHVSLELLFLGGSVPPTMDGRRFLLHRTVGFSTRPGPRPDLVIGFNPGFALKESWFSALPRLQRPPSPAPPPASPPPQRRRDKRPPRRRR
ncbi:LOW QUALITY PROTEIN: zinc finger MYND domain-containing protein 15 [Gavia stellata]|uniref:LOW QUALITY PROTEIN: zinc finger MYND domain-containing protein 15 n=1 Tax=Gavia stellata TaxID=37040 RepID=UPI00289DB5C0|nr:LOW QUALITY PROTEIN: zinc finger MYND domain-containing protein 15 [Gavia stellata]